ncbi:hypothetical protein CRM22_003966 [Opisthorchis felineus]|uniref:MCMDC2 N-terminal domain-containing protein n=1 Tax=Opisthorchis felineus TaxID=147828 RepID=A0A4S2LYS3_OPIFE|nr:hypothetical protein CRM22_003966 [Opisthorchis felineus]
MADKISRVGMLVRYMDSTGQLQSIKLALLKHFRTEVSVHEILHRNVSMGMVVLKSLREVENDLQEIVFALGVAENIVNEDDDINCIGVNITITDMPTLNDDFSKCVQFKPGKLTVCTGTIFALSDMYAVSQKNVYSCQDMCCPGSSEFRIFTSDNNAKAKRCAYCQSELAEEVRKRCNSDLVEFLLLAPTRTSKSTSTAFSESPWTIRQSVICVAAGELVERLYLGMHCCVIGVPELHLVSNQLCWRFNVRNIENPQPCLLDPWKYAVTSAVDRIPSYAREFEFGTSFTLSYLFLEHICPAGSYFLLKWLLLLLLIKNRHRVPGNCQPNDGDRGNKVPHNMTSITSRISSCPPTLLLIGPVSCPIAGRLLRAAGHYAHPYWEHKSGRKLLPTALEVDASGARRPTNKRRSQVGQGMASGTKGTKCGQVWSPTDPASMAHCGTLELATGGVAFFPMIELLKRKELTNLLYALENIAKCQNTPSNETVFSESEQGDKSFAEYFATTSIWATTEVKSNKNARNLNIMNEVDAESHALEPVEAQSAGELVSRSGGLQRASRAFDIIVNMENAAGPSEIVDALAAEHCLKETMRCDARHTRADTCASANSVFDSILSSCNEVPSAEMSQEVIQLLQVYYLAVRRACTNDRFIVPSAALDTLFQLTSSNAKLNGRTVANASDATVAVYLYDSFVDNHTSTNYLGVPSLHYTPSLNCESMNDLNERLQCVYAQLTGLIKVGFNEVS